ncbi:hypothetical protein LX64_01842 [Chitinophaga skermanii]|uniref:Uncharacterized protein n=1 Tax=Chitinophaga skermanii TaxID=331697 RepID=A0A327QS45_9BACT|nr:hypothetical protein [Chitinophaga skermanii]RAJ06715.1 hypothetical protein LX64_01842 [Chitinophaga skermanii]
MKKLCLLVILLSITHLLVLARGQNDYGFNPSRGLPPPVGAATMNKAGDVALNYATGVPNVGVPLIQEQSRSIPIHIALNYGSNGICVNELASDVWMG